MKRFGIIGAMREEISSLVAELEDVQTHSEGMREYHEGTLWGVPVVLVFSRWGKVAASTTATHLISKFGVDALLFTGVAGGVAPGVRVGDVVIGRGLYHHDLDARPLFERHEIPLLGRNALQCDESLRARLEQASRLFLKNDFESMLGIQNPEVRVGEIASGDQFFASQEQVDDLRSRLPDVLCVEMEGAAVAQVCHEYQVPFAIVRTISDSSNEHAPVDFPKFVDQVARVYSRGILKEFFRELRH